MEIFDVEKNVIYSKGRRRIQVDSSKKSPVLLARARAMTYGHRISQALWDDATRGEQIAKERNSQAVSDNPGGYGRGAESESRRQGIARGCLSGS